MSNYYESCLNIMSSTAGTVHVNTIYRKLLCSSDNDRCLIYNSVSTKVKFAHESHGPSGWSLSRFLYHEVTKSTVLYFYSLLEWEASPLQYYPPAFELVVPIKM